MTEPPGSANSNLMEEDDFNRTSTASSLVNRSSGYSVFRCLSSGLEFSTPWSLDVGGVNSPHKHIGITRSTIGAGILANNITIRKDPISIEDQYPDIFGQPDSSSLHKQDGRNALESRIQMQKENNYILHITLFISDIDVPINQKGQFYSSNE